MVFHKEDGTPVNDGTAYTDEEHRPNSLPSSLVSHVHFENEAGVKTGRDP